MAYSQVPSFARSVTPKDEIKEESRKSVEQVIKDMDLHDLATQGNVENRSWLRRVRKAINATYSAEKIIKQQRIELLRSVRSEFKLEGEKKFMKDEEVDKMKPRKLYSDVTQIFHEFVPDGSDWDDYKDYINDDEDMYKSLWTI